VAEAEEPDSPETRRHRRGLKFRKREDHAVELFHEAQGNLGDVARVDRILLELGRFYPELAGDVLVCVTETVSREKIDELVGIYTVS